MRQSLFALVALMAAALASPSAARETWPLWGETRTGMSPATISAMFPDARKPKYPQQLLRSLSRAMETGRPEYRGEELLRDCTQRYEDAAVCASFFFEGGELFGVILTAIETGDTPAQTSALAARFKSSIVALNGAPKECSGSYNPAGFDGPSSFCTWLQGRYRVEVNYAHGRLSEINRDKRPMIHVSFMLLTPETAAALAK